MPQASKHTENTELGMAKIDATGMDGTELSEVLFPGIPRIP
jgi:hypothetical protein